MVLSFKYRLTGVIKVRIHESKSTFYRAAGFTVFCSKKICVEDSNLFCKTVFFLTVFYSISRIRSRSHPKCSAPDRIHNTVKYRNIKAQSGPQKYGTYLSSWPGRSRRCLLPWADDLWWSSSACPEPLRTTSPPLPPLCYPEIIELQIRMVSSSHPTVHYNTVNIVHWPASQPASPTWKIRG